MLGSEWYRQMYRNFPSMFWAKWLKPKVGDKCDEAILAYIRGYLHSVTLSSTFAVQTPRIHLFDFRSTSRLRRGKYCFASLMNCSRLLNKRASSSFFTEGFRGHMRKAQIVRWWWLSASIATLSYRTVVLSQFGSITCTERHHSQRLSRRIHLLFFLASIVNICGLIYLRRVQSVVQRRYPTIYIYFCFTKSFARSNWRTRVTSTMALPYYGSNSLDIVYWKFRTTPDLTNFTVLSAPVLLYNHITSYSTFNFPINPSSSDISLRSRIHNGDCETQQAKATSEAVRVLHWQWHP